jgi:endoglucanase
VPASLLLALAFPLLLAGGVASHPADSPETLDARAAAADMGIGINIGNTLDNTTQWETGWGNPRITKEYVESLAALGFRTVRLPVAWDTYARGGVIQPDKFARVNEVVDWITGAGMYCVINIHWDGGWIDSSNKEKFAGTYATFSADAERKYRSYWEQIARRFADKDGRVLFEALNEETHFEKAGTVKDAYATLTKVNQIFIDTVRQTGGNNAHRLLIVTGYATDFTKTSSDDYVLPKDTVPHKLLLSVHYYTPWQFAGMTEDASWGKMMPTWGSARDAAELERLFDLMAGFSRRHDIPVFVGEYGATDKKETPSRVRWMSAVAKASLERKMVPVLWDTGGDVSRRAPYAPSPALRQVLDGLTGTN